MGKTNTNWEVVNIFKDRTEHVDCKEHFRLKKYEVTLKEVAKVRFGTHCKYNINYHIVWIAKTRMSILVEPFKTDIEKIIEKIGIAQKHQPGPLIGRPRVWFNQRHCFQMPARPFSNVFFKKMAVRDNAGRNGGD